MTPASDVEKSPQPNVKQADIAQPEFTPKHQKKILNKIDLRVTVVCGVLYFISLLDRGNLGFANING